ncbi:MAG: hypothetical protein WCK98_02120 [bacterium]
MNKNILVLGVGGHGWEVLSQFIYNYQGPISFFCQTVDYGGSGGVWYRLLEHNDFELNKKLHSDKIKPILPWGDLNKIITHFFVHKHGLLGGKILDFRSDDLNLHLKEIEILAHLLGMEVSVEKSFINYFKIAFDYYRTYKNEIDYKTKKEFCLGYVWQDFLHWNLEKVPELSLFYRQYNILPQNLKLYFTYDDRQILEAKTTSGKLVKGEDKIDKSQLKLKPESFQIKNTNKSKQIFSEDFLRALKESQVVIIPPGSISNWLPLINYEAVHSILKDKKLFWIVNPSTFVNEFESQKYLDFLHTKGLRPVLLGKANLLNEIIPINLLEGEKYDDKSASQALLGLL